MALSLSAEQKSINDIFYSNIQYIIPDYQRSYSWEFDQCNQLYLDLVAAWQDHRDYFLGNIIIAKSLDTRKRPQVVDGQQRLITLWLLLKVLSVLCPSLRITDYLIIPSMRKNEEDVLKIHSDVFETCDNVNIKRLYSYSKPYFEERIEKVCDSKGEIKESKCGSRFEYVALLYFQNLRKVNVLDLERFTTFLVDHIYLLPIELNADTIQDASNRALSIFETINNRGMSLENADIFKAKLYNKAMMNGEEALFKNQWAEFRQSTEDLGLAVDDIFRYYSHIIRGKENVITSEKNLRDFFLLDSASPIFKNDYKETMTDLLKIVEILKLIQYLETHDEKIGRWLQILDAYSNGYPRFAIVNYLFVNKNYEVSGFCDFLISLVRLAYSLGATTNVKFEIYKILVRTSKGQIIDSYLLPNEIEDFNQYKMLRKGYALLAYYLDGGSLMEKYWYDKLLSNNDRSELTQAGWTSEQEDNAINSLCNTIAINIPSRRKNMYDKYKYFYNEKLLHPAALFFNSQRSYSDFEVYENDIKKLYNRFFTDETWKD